MKALTSAASAPLAFRRDDAEPVFPLAGAALLLALVGVALWVGWIGRRRGIVPARATLLKSGGWPFFKAAAGGTGSIRVVESARLDLGGRLHVVEWRGQQILIATSGGGAPVVIGRHEGAADGAAASP